MSKVEIEKKIVEAIRAQSQVKQVEPLLKTREGSPYWWKVKLKDREEAFAVHQNWFSLYGDLNPGDHVEYEASESKLKGCLLFDKLRKVEEKKPLEEEMMNLVKEGA